MPKKGKYKEALENISDGKDIDSLKRDNPTYTTPATSEAMLRTLKPFIEDKPLVAVIGSKGEIGKGAVNYLKNQSVSVLEIDQDIGDRADLPDAKVILSGAGDKGSLNKEHLRPSHRVVIDCSVTPQEIEGKRRIYGDLDRDAVATPQNYTPVPLGVGPMEMAVLSERATEQALEIEITPLES